MLSRIATWAGRLIGGLITAMALSSHFASTTIGFDFEAATPAGFEVTYDRLRWDDGATWAGWAVQGVARPHEPPDWFDPGGTWLDRPSRPERPRWWNRFGCWWIAGAADDPYVKLRYPGARASGWAGLPSWLVVGGIWAPAFVRARQRRRSGSTGPIAEVRLK